MSEVINVVLEREELLVTVVLPGQKGDKGEAGSAADLTPLEAAVDEEVAARQAGDTALDGRLDLLEAISFATDSELATAVAGEATARASADTALQDNLDTVETAGLAADAALDGRLEDLEANDADAQFLTATASSGLGAERVVTNTPSVTWDIGTAGQAKAKRAALTGDVAAAADSNATTIQPDAVTTAKVADDQVTNAKLANMGTDRLKGRDTAGTGDPEDLTVGGGIEFTGSGGIQRSALTGDVTASAGSSATVIKDDVALGGNPTAVTQSLGNNTTRLANTAFVQAAITALIASAPGVLDTLDEIAAALGDDPNFAATIATSLAGKQPLDTDLTAIAALVSAANKLAYATGSGTWSLTDFTAFARTLLDDPDAATGRATLGLVIGTDVQAYHANLAAMAGLLGASDRLAYFTGVGTLSLATFTAAGRALVDDADAAAQRTTLGLAALAVLATVGTAQIDNDAVTYAKIQNVSATDKLLGRSSAGAGDVEEITCTAAGRALIDDTSAAAMLTTLGLPAANSRARTFLLMGG